MAGREAVSASRGGSRRDAPPAPAAPHLLQARRAGGPEDRSIVAAAGFSAHLSGQNQAVQGVPAHAHWQVTPGSLPRASTWPAQGPPADPPGMQRAGSALPPPPAGAKTQAQHGSGKLGKWQDKPLPVVPSRKLGKGALVPPKVRCLSPQEL